MTNESEPTAFLTFDPMRVALENICRDLLAIQTKLADATARAEQAEAEVERLREALTAARREIEWLNGAK